MSTRTPANAPQYVYDIVQCSEEHTTHAVIVAAGIPILSLANERASTLYTDALLANDMDTYYRVVSRDIAVIHEGDTYGVRARYTSVRGSASAHVDTAMQGAIDSCLRAIPRGHYPVALRCERLYDIDIPVDMYVYTATAVYFACSTEATNHE